jgi:peptidoglycan/xylan/chitin deacetylase (PgdA/CDA1 family)
VKRPVGPAVSIEDAEQRARLEVRACRERPGLRSTSSFAKLADESKPRRIARALALKNYPAADAFLCACGWVVTQLGLRHAALRLSNARAQCAWLRSAVRTAGAWQAFQAEFDLGTPALLYHHVGPTRAGTNPLMTITPARFTAQLRWLVAHGYAGISPAQWLAWRVAGTPLPPRPVIITFDDAYAETAEHAFPALLERGFSAGVFVVTGAIGRTNEWDLAGGWASAPHAVMSAESIREWHTRGIQFGAHTRTHVDLRLLNDADLANELRGSGDDLAALLGERPTAFAYPHGLHDARVRAATATHFPLAFTCEETGLNYLGTAASRLRRVMILPQDTLLEFGLRVRLGWTPVEWLRRLRRYRLRRLFWPWRRSDTRASA